MRRERIDHSARAGNGELWRRQRRSRHLEYCRCRCR